MEFKPETLANVHARMAHIKAHSNHSFSTNYFRQEMVGQQILFTATDQTIVLANDEYDFFRLYFSPAILLISDRCYIMSGIRVT
ncbi:MAG: hypothetical protein DME40_13435 [Verrucomicrobia bacterium]|nr:MAG: hypothetical protein DME40_13435 [Verrucomicrobiota bacterium]